MLPVGILADVWSTRMKRVTSDPSKSMVGRLLPTTFLEPGLAAPIDGYAKYLPLQAVLWQRLSDIMRKFLLASARSSLRQYRRSVTTSIMVKEFLLKRARYTASVLTSKLPSLTPMRSGPKIGRASGRERGWQYV